MQMHSFQFLPGTSRCGKAALASAAIRLLVAGTIFSSFMTASGQTLIPVLNQKSNSPEVALLQAVPLTDSPSSQLPRPVAPIPPRGLTTLQQLPTPESSSNAPLLLTLRDALQRAKLNSPQLQAAFNAYQIAHEDTRQARAAFLPAVTYSNQYLYTEGNGTPTPRFIANNAVHEYLSQGNAHEILGFAQLSEYRRSQALETVARARAEVAARGLVATVVQFYYALVIAERRYAGAQQAGAEAQRLFQITQQLEQAGEVAHSDVIKAQLQLQAGQQALLENQLTGQKARAQLALLLFTDFNQNFSVVDDLRLSQPLAPFAEVEQQAKLNNPDLRLASAGIAAAIQETATARAAYLPALTLDYFYGIDATHFATRTNGLPNLGYSAQATLIVPVWNWGITRSKILQSNLRRQQARLELTFAQRKLLADLRTSYGEAQTARLQLDLLRNSADLAAESLRLTTLRYRAGEATILEVVDAQNTLILVRNSYDDGEARYRFALANLQTLTGIN